MVFDRGHGIFGPPINRAVLHVFVRCSSQVQRVLSGCALGERPQHERAEFRLRQVRKLVDPEAEGVQALLLLGVVLLDAPDVLLEYATPRCVALRAQHAAVQEFIVGIKVLVPLLPGI